MGAQKRHQGGRRAGALQPHALPSVPTGPQHMPGPACPVQPLTPATLSCGLSSPALTLLSSGLWAAQDPREGRSDLERKTSPVRDTCATRWRHQHRTTQGPSSWLERVAA